MRKLRCVVVVLGMLLCCSAVPASAGVSISIGLPHVSIGINLPLFPQLVPVPGYPVYYAPRVAANYFFYDGMYWVYRDDYWYASYWYNGPWWVVDPLDIPVFLLRIPVRYYHYPPVYFRGWRPDAPPHWGEYWGPAWEQRRQGWDRWNRNAVPARAPLPAYQRRYPGERYPSPERQQTLHQQYYHYQPRDKAVRQQLQQRRGPQGPAPAPRQGQPLRQLQQGRPAVPGVQPPPSPPPTYQQRRLPFQEQRPQDREQQRGYDQDRWQPRGGGPGPQRDEGQGR